MIRTLIAGIESLYSLIIGMVKLSLLLVVFAGVSLFYPVIGTLGLHASILVVGYRTVGILIPTATSFFLLIRWHLVRLSTKQGIWEGNGRTVAYTMLMLFVGAILISRLGTYKEKIADGMKSSPLNLGSDDNQESTTT